MRPAVLVLLPLLASLTWTWWAFFRTRVTICVADKRRAPVWVQYPSNPHIEGDLPVWHQEYQYVLTDCQRRQWVVSRATFEWAKVGETVTLRQFVDEWRLAGRISHLC